MKTLKKVEVKYCFVEFIPENDKLVEGTIYISKQYYTSVHLCLCGCGNLSVTPTGNDGWSITEKDNKISFTPSILNNNCPNKSHYIITNNIANFV